MLSVLTTDNISNILKYRGDNMKLIIYFTNSQKLEFDNIVDFEIKCDDCVHFSFKFDKQIQFTDNDNDVYYLTHELNLFHNSFIKYEVIMWKIQLKIF